MYTGTLRKLTERDYAIASGYPDNFICTTEYCYVLYHNRPAWFRCKICKKGFKTTCGLAKNFSCLCPECMRNEKRIRRLKSNGY